MQKKEQFDARITPLNSIDYRNNEKWIKLESAFSNRDYDQAHHILFLILDWLCALQKLMKRRNLHQSENFDLVFKSTQNWIFEIARFFERDDRLRAAAERYLERRT